MNIFYTALIESVAYNTTTQGSKWYTISTLNNDNNNDTCNNNNNKKKEKEEE